jgi:RimJ/RimL family protein N-acetyltransferase
MEPSRYSATESLRDGRPVQIRALQPADRDGLQAAVRRMSDESVYRRFFSPKRHFTEREAEYYTNVDFVNHIALVAVLEDDGVARIVGGARYVVAEPGTAEVAFAVDDSLQGRGLGGLLLKHLAAIARAAGLQRLVAHVLAANAAMLKVFEKSALRASIHRERDVLLVTLELFDAPPSPLTGEGRG